MLRCSCLALSRTPSRKRLRPPPRRRQPHQPRPRTPPPPAPKADKPAKSSEPFAEDATLTPKTIIYLKGNTTLDKALETLQDAFKSLNTLIEKQGMTRAGPSMTIYTYPDDPNDLSFSFQAAVPIVEAPKDLPKGDIAVGQSPGGKALKFIYRGAWDNMEDIYEPIASYLDEKQIEVANVHIEEYETDLVTTPDDKLVVTIYVHAEGQVSAGNTADFAICDRLDLALCRALKFRALSIELT